MSNPEKELKRIAKQLGKGSRLFVTYEGEQVKAEVANRPDTTDLHVVIEGQWRATGSPTPAWIEVVPGYQRPVNWEALQRRNTTLPGEIEIAGKTWKESQ